MEDESNGIFNFDINKLKFKKTKDKLTEHQKNYVVFTDEGKQKIKLNSVFLPFGVEFYNKKQILNIELYPKKNNVHNNLYSLLSALEQDFSNKLIINNEIKSEISELTYHSFLKLNSNNSIHVRTYMSQNPNIYTYIGKFKENIMQSSIKGTTCNIEIEIGTMWINSSNYGIILYVKDIQIL